jgi:rRNA-processing protein Efg1
MATWRNIAPAVAARDPPPTSKLSQSGGVSKPVPQGAASGARGKKKSGMKGGKTAKSSGGSSVRGKIRGLQRLLAHRGDSMTATARAAKEAEITSLLALADDRTRRERERELAKKYHMVKFFERRKIERRLQVIAAKAAKPGADDGELSVQRKILEDDLFYVRNFPKDIPYVSLYPSSGHSDASRAAVVAVRSRIAEGPAVADAVPSSPSRDEIDRDGTHSAPEPDAPPPAARDDFFLDDSDD